MAFALPLLASAVAPSLAGMAGMSISPMLASALGAGLTTWGLTGDPMKGLEGGLLGAAGSGIGNMFGGAKAAQAATQAAQGAAQAAPALAVAAPSAGNLFGAFGPALAQTAASAPADLGIPSALSGLGAVTAPGGGMLGSLLGSKYALPLGLGALGLLSQNGQANAQPDSSPGLVHSGSLRPYQQESALTAPYDYRPGIDPEFSYLTPGYADGGGVRIGQGVGKAGIGSPTGMNSAPLSFGMSQAYTPPAQGYGGGSMPDTTMSDTFTPTHPSSGQGFGDIMNSLRSGYGPTPQPMMDQTSSPPIPPPAMPPPAMPQQAAQPPAPAMYTQPTQPMQQPVLNGMGVGTYGQPYNPLTALQGFANGGGIQRMLPMMGDGSSDSVPAMIDGQVPAKLSQGEFIVPADAVSALGNGDTQSGHRQLQAMTNRIRKAKTGKVSMPTRVNPMRMMPV